MFVMPRKKPCLRLTHAAISKFKSPHDAIGARLTPVAGVDHLRTATSSASASSASQPALSSPACTRNAPRLACLPDPPCARIAEHRKSGPPQPRVLPTPRRRGVSAHLSTPLPRARCTRFEAIRAAPKPAHYQSLTSPTPRSMPAKLRIASESYAFARQMRP